MLDGTLLDEDQRRELKRTASATGATRGTREPLERVSTALRRFTPLRSAAATGANGGATDERRAAFDDAAAATAEAAGRVTADVPDEVLAAIPRLLEPGSPGCAAVREHWVELGFAPADVDAYLAEIVAAREGLVAVARLIRDVDDWDAALAHFGSGNPDPAHWGMGFADDDAIDDDAQAFATASRRAGVTPSLYLMTTILLVIDKATAEIARD